MIECRVYKKMPIDEILSNISLHSVAKDGIVVNPDFADQPKVMDLIPKKLRNQEPKYHISQIKKLRRKLPPKP